MDPAEIQTLSVIVPLFNEKGNVGRLRPELIAPFLKMPFHSEFIFVDDGSVDGTGDALRTSFGSEDHVTVVSHPKNLGLGRALRSGIALASGDAVLTLDGDLSFHPREFENLRKAFSPGVDVVLGSPSRGRFEGVSFVRRFFSQAANALYRLLLGRGITSATSLFRLYKAEKLKALTLTADNFDINAEILLKILQAGGIPVEVPVTLGVRTWGVSKMNLIREIVSHCRFFARILLWRLAGSGKSFNS